MGGAGELLGVGGLAAAALFVGAGDSSSSSSVAVHLYRMQGDLNTKMLKIFILIRQSQSKFLNYLAAYLGKDDIFSHVVIILSFTQFFLL